MKRGFNEQVSRFCGFNIRGCNSASLFARATAIAEARRYQNYFRRTLGSGEGADLIRQKLINRLIHSQVVAVVESESDADAVLTGAAQSDKRHYLVVSGSFISGGTKTSAQSVVRLVGKNRQILWTDELSSSPPLRAMVGACFGGVKSIRSATANVADKTVKDLCSAIEADRKKVAVGTASTF